MRMETYETWINQKRLMLKAYGFEESDDVESLLSFIFSAYVDGYCDAMEFQRSIPK